MTSASSRSATSPAPHEMRYVMAMRHGWDVSSTRTKNYLSKPAYRLLSSTGLWPSHETLAHWEPNYLAAEAVGLCLLLRRQNVQSLSAMLSWWPEPLALSR